MPKQLMAIAVIAATFGAPAAFANEGYQIEVQLGETFEQRLETEIGAPRLPETARKADFSRRGKTGTSAVDGFGKREARILSRAVTRELNAALGLAGANPDLSYRVTLVDALPNQPTQGQLSRAEQGVGSLYAGEAHLVGQIVGKDGQVLEIVDYNSFPTLATSFTATAAIWGDAREAIARFSELMSRAALRAEPGV